jgi:hypothetical protein
MGSWARMRQDQESVNKDFPVPDDCKDWRFDLSLWLCHYWKPTRGWGSKVSLWWGYHVRRFPKPPPFHADAIARHFGFVEGVPACQGPVCQEHEWKVVEHG